jgi:hypothetical protein
MSEENAVPSSGRHNLNFRSDGEGSTPRRYSPEDLDVSLSRRENLKPLTLSDLNTVGIKSAVVKIGTLKRNYF